MHDSPIFWKNFFCPKNWGNGPTIRFLEFKEKLVINFHRMCSIMTIFIICCVLDKYFGKNLTPETDQIALSQSDYRIFKLTFSPDQIDEIASFLTCWYKFRKLKVDWTFFGWASSKIDMANLFSGLWNWILFMLVQIHPN